MTSDRKRNLLRRSIIQCERCELSGMVGVRPVPFRGPPNAKVAILGEAPGEEENESGRPFVGASGRLLKKMLAKHSIDLDECFIMNTVSCWPLGHPSAEHEKACRVNVRAQLRLTTARFVLALGNVALHYFDPDVNILSVRGNYEDIGGGRVVFYTVHPSYALRTLDGHGYLKKDLRTFAHLVRAG